MRVVTIALAVLIGGAIAATNARAEEPKPSEPQAAEPFAFGDFSWAPGNYAPLETPLATKYFTPEIRLDTAYHYDFSHPADNTVSGSSEVFRSNEFQITHAGVGGDFKYNNVGFRFMTQFGLYSTTTPRNDASPSRGQWQLDNAYRYISEAYASYHLDVMNGINIQAGLFMSYVGLWSFYNFDNWTYQPSYVSSNTPWFFNGVRVQVFPSDKLKIEPWLVNGWQSYGKFNNAPGFGLQVLWKPVEWFTALGNQYYGTDNLNNAKQERFHTDDSVMARYYNEPKGAISKAAVSLTMDAGCQSGGGMNCNTDSFVGVMAYNRLWFSKDRFGLTLGGGAIRNPGRYLVLLPPINGATAASGTPYFTQNPGDTFTAFDTQVTGDYMPTRNLTFRLEFNHRQANVPYFSGPGGLTPPGASGGVAGGTAGATVAGWQPDLSKVENRITVAMMIRL